MFKRAAISFAMIGLGICSTALGGQWRVGVGRVEMTPKVPTWMAGYAARKRLPDGTLQKLWAKALAFEDQRGERAVIVTTDLIGMIRPLSDAVCRRASKQFGIERKRVLFNSSHTHCGPLVRESAVVSYGLTGEANAGVVQYTKWLEGQLVTLIGAALDDLQPARLAYGQDEATFAMNRRKLTDKGYVIAPNPDGPVDHVVPVLRVSDEKGNLRAVMVGYSCHNTTLGGGFYQYCGDYAGFAQAAIEAAHPGTTALFMMGCGGDANPEPRGTVALATQHGNALAAAAERALGKAMVQVHGPLAVAFDRTALAFVDPPTNAELQARQDQGNVYEKRLTKRLLNKLKNEGSLQTHYDFPAQVIRFGKDLSIIGLGGEVVVDYVLRLRKEFAGERIWVAGYCNEVFAYVPSERVLKEGGYEGARAMIYFGWHGPFKPGVEERVVALTKRLMAQSRQQVD